MTVSDGGVILLDVARESPRDAVEETAPRGVFELKPILSIGLQFGASTSII